MKYKYGLILTLKNIGAFLASWTVAKIKVDLPSFLFALLIYILINVPSDLLLTNHLSKQLVGAEEDGS